MVPECLSKKVVFELRIKDEKESSEVVKVERIPERSNCR